MTNYHFKDPTLTSRKFRGDKFNQKFNINVTYRFSKKKLEYKYLIENSTGISVDSITFEIFVLIFWCSFYCFNI